MPNFDYVGYSNYDYATDAESKRLAMNGIYMHIAETMLGKLYPNIERTRYTEMMFRRDFQEVENNVGVMPLLNVAVSSIRTGLEKFHIYIPGEFIDIALYSETPNSDVGDQISQEVAARPLSRKDMATIAVDALFAIHEAWRKKEAEINENNKNPKKRFMLLPPELVGFDVLMENYFYIYETIQILGLWVEPRYLRNVFEERQKTFLNSTHGNIVHQSGLEGLVAHLDATHPDPELSIAITRQVRAHAPLNSIIIHI